MCNVYLLLLQAKNPIKISMVKTITQKTKVEGQRKLKRRATHNNQRKEKDNPFHGRKLFHPQPF
jgi:hypothetical protein